MIDAKLYIEHIADKLERFRVIMAELGYDSLLISSGQSQLRFADDMAFPFKASSYFKEWLPLTQRANSFLLVSATDRPKLFLDVAEDIWHTPPQSLPAGWEKPFDIVEFASEEQLLKELAEYRNGMAYLGEFNEAQLPEAQCNAETVCQHVDFQRRIKTPFEQACIRKANQLAAGPHMAAKQAFLNGGSELDIKFAYLASCKQADDEMPYGIIAGLNEHAAVLHHYMLDNQAPAEHRSFLIDAGVEVHGYASDITRSWAFDESSEYAALVAAMDTKQLEMAATVTVGGSAIDLHILSHLKIAELLQEFSLVSCSAEAAVEQGITSTFYPHGIGHGLGTNVHELGGQMADAHGTMVPPPDAYPRLRNTGDFSASAVYTVEPGLYFIPSLLAKLKDTPLSAQINWPAVEAFLPYGGVRIEDNVLVLEGGGIENLTRDAFDALS